MGLILRRYLRFILQNKPAIRKAAATAGTDERGRDEDAKGKLAWDCYHGPLNVTPRNGL